MCFIKIYNYNYSVDADPSWLLSEATFEKMGVLMAENGGRLLGLYDEMSAFLTKIKLYSSRGLTDSHELAMFLELYNANPWTRTIGLLLTEGSNHIQKSMSIVLGHNTLSKLFCFIIDRFSHL